MRFTGTLCALLLVADTAFAAEYRGQVKFGGLPVPGATVTATQASQSRSTVTDSQGNYSLGDLADGTWSIQVEMLGFTAIKQDVVVSPGAAPAEWNLKMLPIGEMQAVAAPKQEPPSELPGARAETVKAQGKGRGKRQTATNTPTAFQKTEVNASNPASSGAPTADAQPSSSDGDAGPSELSQRAADGLLINGTTNNGASSPFSLAQAFGNNRRGTRSMYNGNIGAIFDTSALNARSYSLTGQDTPQPPYHHLQGLFAFGGPFKIPRLLRNGGNFFVNYQWVRSKNAFVGTGFVPTKEERAGDLSHTLDPYGKPVVVLDPSTGAPIPGNMIPDSQISQQARALLRLYPLPNFAGGAHYNYQIAETSNIHEDNLQARYNKTLNRKNQISGLFAMQRARADSTDFFQFLDTSDKLGLNLNVTLRHNFTPRFFTTVGLQYNRFATHLLPYFANRENVSGNAGITGNDQSPINWGPPTLNFASGITSLTNALPLVSRNQTSTVSLDNFWARARHNISFGADFRRQQFNLTSQQDPRGAFTFTGAAAGSDLAGFLFGVPDTSSIAFGNADKYFRASTIEAYVNDDWRVTPGFTLNAGIRWEYWSPVTEKYGRLVNLDIAPGFSAIAPVVATDPHGSLTGQTFDDSLIKPYKRAVQPRVAISWRPVAASSVVVRAGYGVYYNTSVYYPIATQMAQQSPLSKNVNVQNSPENPLTLANGFVSPPGATPNTFAVDPNFRPGYAQNWQASVQRDLPRALVLTISYLGSKGTREEQAFLPNTYPLGATSPCSACPSGFSYLVSGGNSTRHAGQVQLRRRLQSGLTASLDYTYAKAIDDAALGGRNQGGSVVAQNWLNLSGERGRSNFDQRHLLSAQIQYTTGMGLHGGTLMNGWKGALFKEWTVATQLSAGTGLPLTPVYLVAVPGTGVTGSIRPDYTGAALYNAPPGLFLNPAAYIAPPEGQWGDAGRNSITGPAQFSLNASLGRVFQMSDRMGLDFRVDATNVLNHVTFPSWNTVITSAQFGLPGTANNMRAIQTTLRLRF